MRKYAMVDENIVTEIAMLDDEGYRKEASYHALIVDIEDMDAQPEVGWIFNGSQLVPEHGGGNVEEQLRGKIKKARLFGVELVAEMVDRVGATNLITNKTEPEVIAIVIALDPLKKLLEGGALFTAMEQITIAKTYFPEMGEHFDYALAKIGAFLGV